MHPTFSPPTASVRASVQASLRRWWWRTLENAAEPQLDPADLVPYRGQGALGGAPAIAIGKPVYGPYLGYAPHTVAGHTLLQNIVIGQVVA